jgi:hypothetical protein
MLARRYHADLRVYIDAAQSLGKAIGANFPEVFRRADRARIVFEKARYELNRHVNWHHCLENTDSVRAVGAKSRSDA